VYYISQKRTKSTAKYVVWDILFSRFFFTGIIIVYTDILREPLINKNKQTSKQKTNKQTNKQAKTNKQTKIHTAYAKTI
jgi:hypothetical protein